MSTGRGCISMGEPSAVVMRVLGSLKLEPSIRRMFQV
jgi:hypothetical protein